jgi:hypothetical protein
MQLECRSCLLGKFAGAAEVLGRGRRFVLEPCTSSKSLYFQLIMPFARISCSEVQGFRRRSSVEGSGLEMTPFEDTRECAWRDSTASLGPGTERQDDTPSSGRRGGEFIDQAPKS